ncbi:2698_t:CDS:10, partial [Gigaspora margarita]
QNKPDYVDNKNAIDYFDENEMNDFDENEMDNFDANEMDDMDIVQSESSLHIEAVENDIQSQECSKQAMNRNSCKSKRSPLILLDNFPMDNFFNRSEHYNSNQSEDGNSEQSKDSNSDQNEHNIDQDIEEETNIEDETDEEYDTIMLLSPLLNVNHSNLYSIIPEPSYNPGVLGDIYNRKVWKEFLDKQGHPFFIGDSTDVRIGLAFNLDYENLILVSIIPSSKEPDTNQLQNYLQPMVNELKQLWSGQLFKTAQYPIGRIFCCALIQIACDIPAACKITGLALHSSKHACSKCTRVFTCFLGTSKLDYSDYIQEDPPLTNAKHRRIALQYKVSTSKCIVQHAWMNDNLPKLDIKQLRFDALTADQWKIWVLVYSIYALHQFLDEANQRFWQVFVIAVLIWSQRIITEAEIEAGHTAMMAFLQYAKQIYANIEKTGTLGHYNFIVQEALDFCVMSGGLINHIVTGSERFPEIYSNYNFYDENQLPKSENSILVSSTAHQATDLKLGDEKYGSFFSCSDLNSHVLAHWQLENERVNWLGIIKFFIEHQVSLPNSKAPTSHYLAIVDWYRRDSQKQSYFYVKSCDKIFKNILSTNANRTYHSELWEDRFVEREIATILPIQRIISRFVKSNGIKLPGTKATLNTLSTNITSLTQSINEMKTILNSSDIKSQLEITKNSINSLKHRFDIYEQNHNEFATTIQHVNNKHGIKIQRIEDTLMTATTTLENLSTSTSALQDTMNNILLHIQSHGNNVSSITNTTINSPCAIMVANPVLTAKVHNKMHYFNGFDDLESQSQDHSYIYDFEHETNEKWNETTITEIREAYFKTLKKEYNTTPAAKMLNDQCSQQYFPNCAWNQIDPSEYFENSDDNYDNIYDE